MDDALYEDIDDLREELLGFLVYYNEHRPHTSLENLTPKEFIFTNFVAKIMRTTLAFITLNAFITAVLNKIITTTMGALYFNPMNDK